MAGSDTNGGDMAAFGCAGAAVLLVAAGAIGWVMNIIEIWNGFDAPVTAKMVVRIAGVVAWPIGAILGWL